MGCSSAAALVAGALCAALLPANAARAFAAAPKVASTPRPAGLPAHTYCTVLVRVGLASGDRPTSASVETSTNRACDAFAANLARRKTFGPATNGSAYLVMFADNSTVTTSTSGVTIADVLIQSQKYRAAIGVLDGYLASHPEDATAEGLMGVAALYSGDSSAALAAFNAAGERLPQRFKPFAVKAYTDAAVAAVQAREFQKAIETASKALGYGATIEALYARGTAHQAFSQYPEAIADFERAKALAAAAKADPASTSGLDLALASAYLFGGQDEKGLALIRSLRARGAEGAKADETLFNYYTQRAGDQLAVAKRQDAIATLEAGARDVPSHAVQLYVQAAGILSNGLMPDWTRVKAEADKALAIDPNSPHANYIAAIAIANLGDRNGALGLLQKARANLTPGDAFGSEIDARIADLTKPPPTPAPATATPAPRSSPR